jgi:hypothetical protein
VSRSSTPTSPRKSSCSSSRTVPLRLAAAHRRPPLQHAQSLKTHWLMPDKIVDVLAAIHHAQALNVTSTIPTSPRPSY